MRRSAAALALALALALAGLAGAESSAPIVILLSWDGVRHDALDRSPPPALARMRREGAQAERLVPPFPSLTFPGHVSLATGTWPDRHGIVANVFRDGERRYSYSPDASFLEAEPLWIAAERQGVRAAVHFWVGSETDWHGQRASERVAPFDASLPESEKVDRLLSWLDRPEATRPRLLMGWWHGTDAVAHRRGPEDEAVAAQLAAQDRELARLLGGLDARGLWPRTSLVIVSDHGMTTVHRRLDAGEWLEAAGVKASVVGAGGTAYVYLADASQRERARRVLARRKGFEVVPREEIPEAWRLRHGRRTGDFVLVAEPPFAFGRPKGLVDAALMRLAGALGRGFGMHGYRPEHPDMGGLFLALGRGIPPGARLPALRAIDVAPTVAGLLGIEPPADSEGRDVLADAP